MDKIIIFLTILVSFVNGITIFNDDSSRILNGNSAANDQFPYAISLQLSSATQQQTRGHRCGGVLITYQHALTAASCLYDVTNGVSTQINSALYRVFAGAALLTNDTISDRVRNIANFTIHPEFIGSPSYVNDIAIITLQTPFSNTTVMPLPAPPITHDPEDFSLCTVAGWGSSDATTTPSVQLRYASKYVYNQQLCSNLYNSFSGSANVIPTMLCAVSFDILATGCVGDNGNALVCNGNLTGILFMPGGCVATSYPELYTRVNNYTTWITSITGSANTFVPSMFSSLLFIVVQVFLTKIVS